MTMTRAGHCYTTLTGTTVKFIGCTWQTAPVLTTAHSYSESRALAGIHRWWPSPRCGFCHARPAHSAIVNNLTGVHMQRVTVGLTLIFMQSAIGCGTGTASTPAAQAGTSASGGSSSTQAGRTSSAVAGQSSTAGRTSVTPPTAATGGSLATAGSAARNAVAGGAAGNAGTGGSAAGTAASSGGGSGGAGKGGSSGSSSAGSSAAGGSSSITGTLGALGAVKPIMNGWATTNGLETLVYLSTSPLTCAQMMTQGVRWLGTLPAGTQVIEIVVGNPSSTKTYTIGTPAALGGGEVNYAEGSKSSASEVTGKTGSITFTTATAKGVQEGMISVSAPFMASGNFHAEWCEGGTEF